jgi:ELWxxDGT repeat protein
VEKRRHGTGNRAGQEHRAEGASSSPANLVVSNGQLFFTADDGVNGIALWKTDGTEDGTELVKDIDPATPAATSAL